MMTSLVLVFFIRTQSAQQLSFSSTNQYRAGQLARNASEIIIGELRGQICSPAFSRKISPGTGTDAFRPLDGSKVYPYVPGTVLTLRKSKGLGYLTLLNWAENDASTGGTGAALYPGGRNLLSGYSGASVSTDQQSKNGHSLAVEARYSVAPGLVQDNADLGMTLPGRWVLMTRSGVQSLPDGGALPDGADTPGTDNAITGRFTYYIYDLGALLDANAAGSPAGALNSVQKGAKSSPAAVDLNQINPGLGDAIAQWRNISTGATFASYLSDFAIPQGFLTAPVGDNAFLSRQDLLRFIDKNVGTTASARASAQYLTHFARASSAPAWAPAYDAVDAGGLATFKYKTDSVIAGSVNRDFLSVRAASGFTRLYGQTASAGDLLVASRFPLSRLSWLADADIASPAFNASAVLTSDLALINATRARNGAPALTESGLIQAAFGLVWDTSDGSWIYAGATGSVVQSSILKLDQVALQNREPNFIELLRATILDGSLGLRSRTFGPFNDGSNFVVDSTYLAEGQVIQIAANILDQNDANSFPSRIQFGTRRASATNIAPCYYGLENIPYVARLVYNPYRPNSAGGAAVSFNATRDYLSAWLEPVLWNPSVGATTAEPSAYRLRLLSGQLWGMTDDAYGGPGGPSDHGDRVLAPRRNSSSAPLTWTALGAVSLGNTLTTPKLLRDLSPSQAIITGGPNDVFTESGSTIAGFWLGQVLAATAPLNVASLYRYTNFRPYWSSLGGAGPTFVLEANYGGGSWREIQRITWRNITATQTLLISQCPDGASARFNNMERRSYDLAFLDPRTARFGMHAHGQGAATGGGYFTLPTSSTTSYFTRTLFKDPANVQNSNNYLPNGTGFSNAVPSASGSMAVYRLADNSATPSTAPGAAPTYNDLDGIQRTGDGWWSSATVNTIPLRMDTDANRPIQLNRPFTNLAELGYVFRDTPWKSLDLVSSKSADAGLLDVFTLNEGEGAFPAVAGRVALNSPHHLILRALIKDVASSQSPTSPTYYSAAEADTLATALTGNNTTEGYLYDSQMRPSGRTPGGISGLVVPTVANPSTDLAGFLDQSQTGTAFAAANAKRIKGEREGIVRALAGTTQGGTWNILIDVTAQVGRYPKGAKTQQEFLVLGEKRYWLSIAIDRFTGKIISEQLEPVTRFDP